MADVDTKKKVELDAMERGYVNAAMDVLLAQRKRGRLAMVDGSELHRYASLEIARIVAIKEKLNAS